jgi:hypothetical protein
MAIRRVDPKATFRVICEFDDALMRETPEELEALKTGKKTASGLFDAAGKEIMIDEVNPTRYEQYIDTLDEAKLKFKEGEKPSYFLIRCLLNSEMAALNEKHITIDPVKKRVDYKDRNKWFLDHFDLGCLGIIEGNALPAVQVNPDDLPVGVAIAVGSIISLFTSTGKHLKK